MPELLRILRSLRDVDGVLGSWVWSEDGSLIVRDVPSICGSDVLRSVGGRVLQLYDAFRSSAGGDLDGATLVFAQYKLQIARLGPVLIGVVTSISVNMAALKMALLIALRQIVPALEAGPVATPDQPAPTATGDESSGAPLRSYRGQRVLG